MATPETPPPPLPAATSSAPTAADLAPVITLRQMGAIVLGVAVILSCGAMAVLALFASPVNLVLVGAMLLGAAAGWSLCIRPAVLLSVAGVTVRNPTRTTFIPWALVDDVGGRWSLEVYSGDRTVPVWAVASHIERPRGASSGASGLGPFGNLFGFGKPGNDPAADAPAPGSTGRRPVRRVTVRTAVETIEQTRLTWAQEVADGLIVAPTEPRLERRWDWLDVALLLVPIVLIVVGILR